MRESYQGTRRNGVGWPSDRSGHALPLAKRQSACCHCDAALTLLHNHRLAILTRISHNAELIRSAGNLSSPAILIVVVWCVTLVGVAIGPIDYPMQPSPVVLAIVVTGVFLFILAYRAGGWCFDNWCQRQARIPAHLDPNAEPRCHGDIADRHRRNWARGPRSHDLQRRQQQRLFGTDALRAWTSRLYRDQANAVALSRDISPSPSALSRWCCSF